MDPEKQDKILDAALEVFIRYGFKKATMGDLAEKAGMSRPSLYLAFSNKEEIFRAVIVRKMEIFQREAQERAEKSTGLEAKLTAVLDAWMLKPYKMISASPEFEDILDFVYSSAADLRRKMLGTLEQQLAEIIRAEPETDQTALAAAGLEIETVARLIAFSSADLKHSISAPDELEQLLTALARINAAFLTGHGNRRPNA